MKHLVAPLLLVISRSIAIDADSAVASTPSSNQLKSARLDKLSPEHLGCLDSLLEGCKTDEVKREW